MASEFHLRDSDSDPYDFNSYVSDPVIEAPAKNDSDPYDFNNYVTEEEPEEDFDMWEETKEFAQDSALDLASGTIQLGQSVVGLGSLLTGGMLGKGMRALGYRPEEANKFLADLRSDDRKQSEKEFEDARGFYDSAKALLTEPAMLAGKVLETAPQMLGIMMTSRALAVKAFDSARKAAIAAGAVPATAQKIALEAAAKIGARSAAATEGAMQAGSSFDQLMQEGVDMGTAYVASIGSGITTGLTSFASGKFAQSKLGQKIGIGDVEAGIASKGGIVSRAAKGMVQEGLMEEAPQSGMEQAWDNYAHGRPLSEGVAKSMTTGGIIGAFAGGGMNMVSGGGTDQTPNLFEPTHTIGDQRVQQATKDGKLIPNTYVNMAGERLTSLEAAEIPEAERDLSMSVEAVAAAIKAEIGQGSDAAVLDTLSDSEQLYEQTMFDGSTAEAVSGATVGDDEFDVRTEALDAYFAAQDESGALSSTEELTEAVLSDLDMVTAGSDITEAGAEAAESPLNDLLEPTTNQKSAGNYKKGHSTVQGFNVTIENPAGSTRKGVDAAGNEWANEMDHHYGYFKRTIGADLDQVDTFIKKDVDIPADNPAYIVDQTNEDGSFDETKVMVGFDTKEDASEGYHSNYPDGWKGAKAITEATPEQLKTWLNDPAANDEYGEYLKGTPKVLKPVEPKVLKPENRSVPNIIASRESPEAERKANMAAKVEQVAAVRAHAAANEGDAGWDFIAKLDDQDASDIFIAKDSPEKAVKRSQQLVDFINQTADAKANVTTTTDETTPTPYNPEDMLARREESPEVNAFFDEFYENSYEHPLMPQSRIVMNKELNTGEDFAMLDVTPTTDANNNDSLYLAAIQSSATGKGNGNAGMKALTDLADKHGLPITLGAKAFGTTEGKMTTPQLKKWYSKWGFNPSETSDPDTMVRPPQDLAPFNPEAGMLARKSWQGKTIADIGMVPAGRKEDGSIVSGKKGDNHVTMFGKEQVGVDEFTELGFTDQSGKFYTREEAMDYVESMGFATDDNHDFGLGGMDKLDARSKFSLDEDFAPPTFPATEKTVGDIGLVPAIQTERSGLIVGEAGQTHLDMELDNWGKNNRVVPEGNELGYVTKDGKFMDRMDALDYAEKQTGKKAKRGAINDSLLSDALFRRGEVDPYAKMDNVEHSYQVKVESTGEIHTVTVNAKEAMVELDQRIEALEELRKCI